VLASARNVEKLESKSAWFIVLAALLRRTLIGRHRQEAPQKRRSSIEMVSLSLSGGQW
jgi:hypothetical protein